MKVVLAIILLISFKASAEDSWIHDPADRGQGSSELDHRNSASILSEVSSDGLKWRAVFKPSQRDSFGEQTIAAGTGKQTHFQINWSPGDVAATLYNDSISIVWFRKTGKVIDLAKEIPTDGSQCKTMIVYGEWLSDSKLWLHSWCDKENLKVWNYDLDKNRVEKIQKNDFYSGSHNDPKIIWELNCGSMSILEKGYGDDDSRQVTLLKDAKEIKILDDDRNTIGAWNSTCDKFLINDENGSDSTELYLIDTGSFVGFASPNEKEQRGLPRGFLVFRDEMEEQLPEFKWVTGFFRLYCYGTWLADGSIQVEVSGADISKSPYRTINNMSFLWQMNGKIKLLNKGVIKN